MCNLFSMTKGQDAMRGLFDGLEDQIGNLPPLTGIYPDYMAPVVSNGETGPVLSMMRWGMPSPAFALKGKKTDRGVTNVRNTRSPHWRRWFGVKHRCVVPFTSFSEPHNQTGKPSEPVWFALSEDRPIAFFAGIWTEWTSVRKLKDGETTDNLFGFLTTEANADVGAIHPKAMPVVLTTKNEIDLWLRAEVDEALTLQRPLADGHLQIVARGTPQDDFGISF
ncbi:SOS response-associated peptidase [uncultured Tateyamaria sp.]|uniref:SOS response-associated peptidase n=1 Tax=uncultured Tateyamaria sp. TaxID=455651 RepID=UPI0026158FAC|nr:SOS response-associated peptidase [uncultured Tateyamaria sp.]